MSKTFDLSTLNLSAGTHEITVKARASGYADSVESNAVSYVVAGDTVQVSGTWKFNYSLTLPTPTMSTTVYFINNGVEYDGINVTQSVLDFTILGLGGTDARERVYQYSKWIDQKYRTITFNGIENMKKEFYDWFVANAVQQTIGFTIDGTTYYAKEGMTWGEWVASEYNTGGFFAGATFIFVYKSGNVRYCIKNEWLEKVIIANTNYVTEIFSGAEPT